MFLRWSRIGEKHSTDARNRENLNVSSDTFGNDAINAFTSKNS